MSRPIEPDFEVSTERIGGDGRIVAVRGEIDVYTAPELRDALKQALDAGCVRVVIDLGGTTFVDSSGLGVLVGAYRRLRDRGGALAIVNDDRDIARTFEITGLDELLPIAGTRDEAVAALDGRSP